MRSDWQEQAVCASVEPDLFYPAPHEHGRRRQAKALCASCPVVNECLQWALEINDKFAILGGLTAHEREAIKGTARGRTSGVCKNGHSFAEHGLMGRFRMVCLACKRERTAS